MALMILSKATVIFLHFRKSKLCRRHRFSNIVKTVLFILRCTKLYTNNIKTRRYKTKQTLLMGHTGNKLEWNQIDV